MLFLKMLRDIKRQKMQFISIFLMAFLGMFIYSGLCSEWYGIQTYLNDYNHVTNLCDVWVYSENFTKQDIVTLENQKDILGVQRRLYVPAIGSGEHKPTLKLYFLEKNELNLPLLKEGAEIDLNDMKSIWLDYNFAKANGLSLGDLYSFKIGDVTVEKVIAGLVYSSEYTYYKKASSLWPDYKDIGFGFCPIVGFPIVDETSDRLKYEGMDTLDILQSMLNEDYARFVNSVVDNRYDEIVEAFAQDNYDDFIADIVDEDYYSIVSEYVQENYDSVIKEYISQNKDFVIDEYVKESYDSILNHYILKNRESLILSYIDKNYDELVNIYVENNFSSIVDDLIYPQHEKSELTKKDLREAFVFEHGENMIKENAKQSVSKDQIAEMLKSSLTHFDIKNIVSESFTNDYVKTITEENLNESDIIEIAKSKYTVDDLISLTIEGYSASDIVAIIKDKYSLDDIKEIIGDRYTTDEVKDLLQKTYTADGMLSLITERYESEELQSLLAVSLLDMAEEEVIFNELLVKTTQADLVSLEEDLGKTLENGVTLLLGRKNVIGVWDLFDKTEAHKAISNIFPAAFIIIAILIIVTTMSRIVVNQRTQIGTLKALGFSKKRIMLHYLGYGFFPSLAGVLLGLIVGARTFPYILYTSMAQSYSLPQWESAISPTFWIMAAVCVLSCTVATFFAVRNVLAECPAQSLRPKVAEKFNGLKIEESRLWKLLRFGVQWNIRDVLRSKIRSAMAIIGAMSTMALLMCGFSVQDTLHDTMRWVYEDIQKYNTQIVLSEDANADEAALIAAKYGGQLMQTCAVEIRNGTDFEIVILNVVEDTSLYSITDESKNQLELNDKDVAISRKLAERLNIEKESDFNLRMSEDWLRVKASVINCSPIFQGITMTRSALESLGMEFEPTSIIVGDDIEKFDSEWVSEIYTSKDLKDAWNFSTEFFILLTVIMILAATMLCVVVLYNLGLLSFLEKEREFATLKVLGFKSDTVRRLLLTQNLWFSSLGILLGIPLGNWLNRKICVVLGSGYDLTGIYTTSSLFFCSLIVLMISIGTSLMFSKKLKKLDMAKAFRTD